MPRDSMFFEEQVRKGRRRLRALRLALEEDDDLNLQSHEARRLLREARFHLGNSLKEFGGNDPYPKYTNRRKTQGSNKVAPEADQARSYPLAADGPLEKVDELREEIQKAEVGLKQLIKFTYELLPSSPKCEYVTMFLHDAFRKVTLARNYLGLLLQEFGEVEGEEEKEPPKKEYKYDFGS